MDYNCTNNYFSVCLRYFNDIEIILNSVLADILDLLANKIMLFFLNYLSNEIISKYLDDNPSSDNSIFAYL